MKTAQLERMLAQHVLWLRSTEPGMPIAAKEGTRADFNGMDLREHVHAFNRAELRYAQFSGAVLSRLEFHNADLRECNFHGAMMWGTDLRGAALHDADFEGAQIIGIKLSERFEWNELRVAINVHKAIRE
jgi:hypothetical protein